jgi:hypothetical protein
MRDARFTFSIITLLILIGLAVHSHNAGIAQRPEQTNDKAAAAKSEACEQEQAAAIESFITYAQSVPAEFSVDLLIQAVESGEIKDPKRRQELLTESFYAAAKAKQAVKLVGLPGSDVDSRAGYRATASNAGLDALSLQCRAIKALLPLNKKKARRLFSEIKLTVDPLSCEDPFSYDVDCFFSTMQALAQTAFSVEEINRGEHAYFVESYISKINSPNQVAAAAKVLVSLKTSDLELANLGRAFSAGLQKIPSDYRSFSASRNSANAVIELISKFQQRGLSSDEIIDAYRTYLINQLSGPRCADSGATKEQRELESNLITYFNEKLRSLAYKKIASISEDEIKPTKQEGVATTELYWTSPKSKSILSRVRKLRFSSAGKEYRDQEKESAEWQSELSEFVRELASWNAADEKSEEDYFHQKCVVYYALLKIIPAGAQYDGVMDEALRDFATLLSSSPLQKEKPAEWYLHAKTLIDRVNTAQPRERDKLTNLIYSSRSTVLHLYVQKQQLFKTTKE